MHVYAQTHIHEYICTHAPARTQHLFCETDVSPVKLGQKMGPKTERKLNSRCSSKKEMVETQRGGAAECSEENNIVRTSLHDPQ